MMKSPSLNFSLASFIPGINLAISLVVKIRSIFCIKSLWWQEGGVSEYRDAKMFNDEHRKLIKKWPAYCHETKNKIKIK